ncbi:MAG TPA: PIN domain-containing protein [Rhizomicrobium sp.]|jgi:predicted nucleic acid-binding protein
MRHGEPVFVDSGAWVALAISQDSLHLAAREQWTILAEAGARLHTSIPVVIETFTFLERNANRDVAIAWKDSIYRPGTVKLLSCELGDLEQSWTYFERKEFHKLSAVDATSLAIMHRAGIRTAYAFDRHFALAGFRFVG